MIHLLNCGFFSYPKDVERGNQDSFLLPKHIDGGYVLAVADGVGSYLGAREAADAAIFTTEILSSNTLRDVASAFKAIKNNVDILTERNNQWFKAATTLSYCFIDDEYLHFGHVGDTRIYFKSGARLIALTRDHTQHQELLDEGIYTKRELRDMPGKNALTSAISKNLPLRFQKDSIPLSRIADENGVITLYLMSDGAHHFWEKRPRLSVNTLSKGPLFASSLLKRIERNEAIDDYTLIAVSFKVS
ncbi:PP2C family protein-serine/threonine phosphatase [Klebsiella aerogenes]|uniref:PP2C family protein-serine/threonine phosphatase n=1 Tax=Klebsiella aerogenes TaxID=548 RepID=UPI001919362A|nr:protein phosphatase 2C domain-containing protein [Klebsiella aerogenes]MDG4538110.1 protein phosphatase 2C domain-containing protein [Klebsiella aerogenes]HBQ0466587.1 protein phosphatase 2C domain-containing protein [Klebsiella aerogenes]HBU8352598.1 protein phosphatase 2C domain-containing protein [Klebsiella aerogenes]HCB3011470.1 protein phosphatase 2C domain-containing protein [Klebsiella aerogenes]